MRHTSTSPASGLPTLALLLLAIVASGCATAPWKCTSDTCVTVATADLPEGVRGTWRGADGTTLEVHAIYVGNLEDQEVFPRAATMHWSPRPPLGVNAHVTSFDGTTAVAERRMGNEEGAPRRFLRLRVQGDSLQTAELRLDALLYVANRGDVQIVTTEAGDAVVYDDVRAMAATIQQLLADPAVWENEASYVRSSS